MTCCNDKCQDYEMWTGLVLFVVGAVFLLQRFDLIPPETWFYLWPILLLVFGIKMMVAGGSNHCCSSGCDLKSHAPAKKAATKKKKAPKKRKIAKK
jgi:hypothetical protein